MAIAQATGLTPERMRREQANLYRSIARIAAERLLDSIEQIPLSQLAVVSAITTDKAAMLDGDPVAIVEHRSVKTLDVNAVMMKYLTPEAQARMGFNSDGSQVSEPTPALPSATPEAAR